MSKAALHPSPITHYPLRSGFTLIEMLVVMLIMGLFVGLVSAIVRPDDRTLLRFEADRLAQLLDLAAEESRLTGKAIAWTADGSNYRFWRFQEDSGWSEIRDSDTLRARALPQGIRISDLQIEAMRPQGDMRLAFSPYGLTPSFNIEMSFGSERYTVTGFPAGTVRAFPGTGQTNDNMALR